MTDAERLDRLRAALRATGDALANARLDDLLAAEVSLAQALDGWPAGAAAPWTTDRAALEREIRGARADLLRCRRLGAALAQFSSAIPGTAANTYSRNGAPLARAGLVSVDMRG